VLSAWTGDGSGYQVAQKQPMKLAAMEGYYEGRQGAGLVAFGLLNPAKQTPQDGVDPFLFRVEIPKMLSLLAERKMDAFVPGINDLLKGGYPLSDGTVALSAEEKIEKGKTAIGAFAAYRAAKAAGNEADAAGGCQSVERECSLFRLRLYQGRERAGAQCAPYVLHVPCDGDVGWVLHPLLYCGAVPGL